MSTAHDLVDAYLTHLQVERRLADHTLESYSRDLQRLGEFAAGIEKPVQQLDRRDLEDFVDALMTEGLSPRSVARMVAAVQRLLPLLVLAQHLDTNPADDLQAPAGMARVAEISRRRGSRTAHPAARHRHAARSARSRADRGPLRDRHAGLRAHSPARERSQSRGRLFVDAREKGTSSGSCRSAIRRAEWLTKYIRHGTPGVVGKALRHGCS